MQTEKQVNPHFEDFLTDWEENIQLLVGGYGSSKSYHIALKIIFKLLEEKRKCLVVREVYGTLKESCYDLFLEIIEDLEIDRYVKCLSSPLEIKFLNTGSRIIFRGMDKPAKLKSINDVTLVWLEESSEVKYAGYKELRGRLRHPSLPIYYIISTNPAPKSNWVYKHFFKDALNNRNVLDDEELYKKRIMKHNGTYYHHSTPDDNNFLQADYIAQLDEMQEYDPDLYRAARLGRFGVSGLVVFPQFEVMEHEKVVNSIKYIPDAYKRVGMDFGFVTSYNAVVRLAIDHDEKILYIYYEYYKNKMTDDKTKEDLDEFRRTGELIRADAAEPKTIQYYRQEGFNMKAAKKFAGSRLQYTKKVKRFKKIICSDACLNCINELKELTYEVDKNGNIIEDNFNIDPHTLSAIWYALDGYEVSDVKGAFAKI